MMRVFAFALPVVASLLVAFVAWVVLGNSRSDTSPATPGDRSPTVAATASPDLREPGDVCQGTLSRPEPGSPTRFADEYTQQREVLGLHIVANADVPAEALEIAERTMRDLLRDEDLSEPLASEGAYVIVMSDGQSVLDLPEFSCLNEALGSDVYNHVCGVADRADYPVVTVSELDLTGDSRGPCRGLNILYHELGHLVHGWAVGSADYVDVRILYQAALGMPIYEGEYAARNVNEYFAEATQAYFLSIDRRGRKDREWLQTNDPEMYQLLTLIYGE